MKTQIIRIAVVALMMTSAFSNVSNAKDKDPKEKPAIAWSSIKPFGYGKKMQVSFQANNVDGLASVQIKDQSGTVVYQEHVKNPRTFRKVYDLNQLEQGVYTLEVTAGETKSEKTFVIDEMMYDTKLRAIFLAGSEYKNFRIGMENAARTEVKIQVKDAEGNVVYNETLPNVYKTIYTKDFSFLKSGQYTVEVSNPSNAFSKQLLVP